MEETNTLKDISENMKTVEKNKLKYEIGNIHNTIVVEPKTVKSVIPEAVFKEYFLDFFRGFKTNDNQTTLGLKWIELAGSPFNEVDILNTSGDIILTVPPIISRVSTNEALAKINFDAIATTFEQKSNIIAETGINYLNTALNKVDTLVESKTNNTDIAKWKLLFKYYDESKNKSLNIVSDKKQAPVGINLDINYDD